jgi:hypothetical protein
MQTTVPREELIQAAEFIQRNDVDCDEVKFDTDSKYTQFLRIEPDGSRTRVGSIFYSNPQCTGEILLVEA